METNLKPFVLEFNNEQEVVNAVEELVSRGVPQDDLFVLTHDHDRTERLTDKTDAAALEANAHDLRASMEDSFQNRGELLRHKMEEIGLSKEEARLYEEKLDQGKVLLFVNEYGKYQGIL